MKKKVAAPVYPVSSNQLSTIGPLPTRCGECRKYFDITEEMQEKSADIIRRQGFIVSYMGDGYWKAEKEQKKKKGQPGIVEYLRPNTICERANYYEQDGIKEPKKTTRRPRTVRQKPMEVSPHERRPDKDASARVRNRNTDEPGRKRRRSSGDGARASAGVRGPVPRVSSRPGKKAKRVRKNGTRTPRVQRRNNSR